MLYRIFLLLSILHYISSDLAQADQDIVKKEVETLRELNDTIQLSMSTQLVFLMQAGFAMLEMGSVRSKNSMNILLKNLIDIALATIFWQVLGYGIAQGESVNSIFGNPFDIMVGTHYKRNWMFHWAFAGTATTIVSGSLAERCMLISQILASMMITTLIQPVVVHWAWTEEGWLHRLGQADFAGSGVVHMVGGFCGLVGAFFLGPRKGRFLEFEDFEDDPTKPKNILEEEKEKPDEFRPHNVGLVTLGSLILWLGWQGFNGGSVFAVKNGGIKILSRVCISTTIGGTVSGVTSFFLNAYLNEVYSVVSLTNGLIAGFVSISASCDAASYWGSAFIGFIAAILQLLFSMWVKRSLIDDPLDAFAIHGICGMWGVISSGIIRQMNSAGQKVIQANLIGVLAISGWTILISANFQAFFWFIDILRVSEDIESEGLDKAFHGGLGQYIFDKQYERSKRISPMRKFLQSQLSTYSSIQNK